MTKAEVTLKRKACRGIASQGGPGVRTSPATTRLTWDFHKSDEKLFDSLHITVWIVNALNLSPKFILIMLIHKISSDSLYRGFAPGPLLGLPFPRPPILDPLASKTHLHPWSHVKQKLYICHSNHVTHVLRYHATYLPSSREWLTDSLYVSSSRIWFLILGSNDANSPLRIQVPQQIHTRNDIPVHSNWQNTLTVVTWL